MRKRISELKARGAVILGHGAMFKVPLISLALGEWLSSSLVWVT